MEPHIKPVSQEQMSANAAELAERLPHLDSDKVHAALPHFLQKYSELIYLPSTYDQVMDALFTSFCEFEFTPE